MKPAAPAQKRSDLTRRLIGRVLLTLTFLIVAAWALSFRSDPSAYSVGNLSTMRNTGWKLSLAKGAVRLVIYHADDPIDPSDGPPEIVHHERLRQIINTRIPLWSLFLPTLLAGAWLLIPDGSKPWIKKKGACRFCGYDLAGLRTGTTCPECGRGGRRI